MGVLHGAGGQALVEQAGVHGVELARLERLEANAAEVGEQAGADDLAVAGDGARSETGHRPGVEPLRQVLADRDLRGLDERPFPGRHTKRVHRRLGGLLRIEPSPPRLPALAVRALRHELAYLDVDRGLADGVGADADGDAIAAVRALVDEAERPLLTGDERVAADARHLLARQWPGVEARLINAAQLDDGGGLGGAIAELMSTPS